MIKITSDLFDISSRIKNINPSYELYFDKSDNKFKVTANSVVQAVLPYDRLDKRAVDYLYKTGVNNLDNLVEEIEKENERLLKQRNKDFINQTVENIERSLGNK